jgi:hypothetical protein
MSVASAFYQIAKTTLNLVILSAKRALKTTKYTPSKHKEILKDYYAFHENLFIIKMHFDFFNYGGRLTKKFIKNSSTLIAYFDMVYECEGMSSEEYNLVKQLVLLASVKLTKANSGHVWSLLYKCFGKEEIKKDKVLKDLRSSYNTYTSRYIGSKERFTPEVEQLYDFAFKFLVI